MKRRIIYTDAPPEIEEALEHAVIIEDFLPAPEFLVPKTSKEEITIPLNNRSLDFFRKYARKQKTTYQKVISKILENYASQHATTI
ncbi:MAG: BrnA antitoxin family protein [Tannerella sp.]|jgi:predicted DNA binding CopG/RHH family protein|nr:BrnA antitoxin family protein [Tannerella sp.]